MTAAVTNEELDDFWEYLAGPGREQFDLAAAALIQGYVVQCGEHLATALEDKKQSDTEQL